jgi:hypothetical protein
MTEPQETENLFVAGRFPLKQTGLFEVWIHVIVKAFR